MLSWQVGAVKVTRVVEMALPVKAGADFFMPQATPQELRKSPWLYPDFVNEDEIMQMSIHALLVEAPGMRLVVDTCIGNDKPRSLLRGGALSTNFLKDLEAVGWTRESVTAVVCTHLHVDHVGWNTMLVDGKWVPTFPNARYCIGRIEYEHWIADGAGEQQAILDDSVTPIFDAGLAEFVELDHRLSPQIRLIPSTGHTPGHVSVMIESEGQSAVITGDMSHHPCQLAHPDWSPAFDSDPKAAAVTRARLFAEWADAPILVIGTHWAAPTAGRVRRDGAAFRFEVKAHADA
ncbi:MAG TPA: MBL fold metallo-hydrolase [Caulobacteraceae bacterium]|nr:MBL fold metallo-hydrolase [Xanthobacteraceae bacterium]HXQ13677.1 MBL fold metallo-hydrolase [Caulobacteraceae bacterium]